MHHSVVLKARPRHSVIEPLESRIAPAKLFAVTTANHLISFDSATPGTIASDVLITGLGAGEQIDGADIRPATGQLYGMGITDNGATRTGQIYTIDATTGAATAVGAAFSAVLSDTDLWGFDFNPTVDRIRIVDGLGGTSLRVNPNTGALAATDTNLTAGSLIDGVAYDRVAGGTTLTTLFGLDHSNNNLVRIGGVDGTPSPNGGVVTNVGALGIVPTGAFNFDIEAITGVARASAVVGGNTQLFTINLTTGAATAVGNIGTGATAISAMTSASAALAVVGTAANDTLLFTKTGYSLNGGAVVPLTGITSFSFLGLTGDDTVTVDFVSGDPGLTGAFTFIGGGDAGDKLAIAGTNTQTAVWNPSNTVAGSGSITVGTGVAYNYSGVTAGLDVSKLSALTLRTGAGVDSFTLASAAAGIGDLSGTSSGFAHKIVYTTTTSLNVDLGTNDAGTEADTLTVSALAGTGLQNLAVTTGPGNDQVSLNVTSLALPLAGGAFSYDGSVGTGDIVSATADVNMTLSNTSLAFTGAGSVTLANVEVANLTGGAGNNSLTVANWTGTGTYNGAAGTNSVILGAANDSFTVSANRAGAGSGINFTSIDSVDGAGGANTLTNTSGQVYAGATNTVAGITVTNFGTVNTSLLSLTAGIDTFTVTGNGTGTFGAINFTGLTAVDALGGVDKINLTAGADSITVAGTSAVTVAAIAFTNVETVDALGGTDSVVLPGGPDAITVTGNNAFTIPVSNLAFANVEAVDGTAGVNSITLTAGNDAFTITGNRGGSGFGMTFSSFDNVDGGAGVNSLTNASGAAFAAATNSAANVTVTNFANISTPSLTLTNNADAFTVTAAGAGTFAGVNYTSLVNVDGLLATDTITLTAGNDAIQLNGTNAATTSAIAFTNIEAIAAAGGTDTVTLTAGSDAIAVNAANAATISGIAFTAIENLDAVGGADTVTLLAANDAIQANVANAATTLGIAFTNIEAIDGAGGSNAVTLTAGNDTFTITNTRTGNGGGINYTNIDSVDGGAGANTLINATAQTYSAATNSVAGVTAANFQTVNTATLSLTVGNDSFTVTGAGAGTFAGVAYTGLTGVDALAGTDTITLTAGNDAVVVSGSNAAATSGIAFTNIEAIDGAIGANSVTLTAGADTFTVTGNRAGSTLGIAFTNIDSVNADGGATDTVVLLAGNDAVLVSGPSAATTSNIAFSNIETIDGAAGTNSVTLTQDNETFTVTGNRAGSTLGIAFTNIDSVDADDLTADKVVLLGGNDTVLVTGPNAATTSGIAFSNIEMIDGAGGTNSVTLTGNDDSFTVSGNRAGSGLGIAFTNIDSVNGAAGSNTLANASGQIYAAETHTVAGVAVANFGTVNTPLLSLTPGADTFTVAGAGTGTFAGVNYTGLTSVDALAGIDTIVLTAGNDAVAVNAANAATVLGIAFTNIEAMNGAAGANSVTLTPGNDAFTVSGNRAGAGFGIAFTNIDSVDGAAGSNTLTNTSGLVFAAETHRVALATVANFGTVSTPLLSLTAGADNFLLTGAGTGTFAAVNYTNLTTVDALGASDTISATQNADFVLSDSALSVGVSNLGLASFEVANLTGGSGDNTFTISGWTGTGTLTGAAGAGDTVAAVNDVDFVLANGSLARTGRGTMVLAGIEVANLTGGAGDNSFTVSGWTAGRSGKITGGGGSDTIIAAKSRKFLLKNKRLYTSVDRMNLALDGIANASLVGIDVKGTDNKNVFDARTYTGNLTIKARDGNDTLIGGRGINNLNGGSGDDHYVLSGDADFLKDTNTGGFDLIDYTLSERGVKVNLSKVGVEKNVNAFSTLFLSGSFEYLAGSGQDDILIGSAANNVIFGGAGNDLIKADPVSGLTGTNYLIGGDGFDSIVPGQGVDFIQNDGIRPFVKIPSVVPRSPVRALALVKASHHTAVSESFLKILAGSHLAGLA